MLTGCNSEKEKTAEKEKTPTEAVTTVSTESTETASTSTVETFSITTDICITETETSSLNTENTAVTEKPVSTDAAADASASTETALQGIKILDDGTIEFPMIQIE